MRRYDSNLRNAVLGSGGRQGNSEATSSLSVVGNVSGVSACNLPDQRQAEPTALRTASSGNPVKSRKQPLTRIFGDDWSMIQDTEHSLITLAPDGHLNGWPAMKLGIFDEVADHSTQQHGIPAHHDRLTFDAATVVSRAFLGRERGQVRVLTSIQLLGRLQAAGEKYFIHELIELGDVSLELQFALRRRPDELETEPYAR
jgi:hypothetical protein